MVLSEISFSSLLGLKGLKDTDAFRYKYSDHILMCSSRKCPYPTPDGRSLEILRGGGGGSQKPYYLRKVTMKPDWNLQWGLYGFKPRKTIHGGYEYFLEQ